jgi:fermentation-respiration switch protein FrsA (DUF1100 family)
MRTRSIVLLSLALLAAPASAGSIANRIYPAPKTPLTLSGLDPAATMISVTTADGLTLTGIAVPARGKPVLLVFHGNGSSAADTMRWFAPLIAEGYGVVAAEYRGYSANPGKPDEAGLAADADAFFEAARARANGAPIWVVGHSLGGGVALGLSRRQKLDAVVTIGAFTRLRVAAPKIARVFVPDAYRNLDAIPALDEPYFLIHGTADGTISANEGKALYEAAVVGKKDGAAFVAEGADHHPPGDMLAAIFAVIERRLTIGRYDATPLPSTVRLIPFGATAPVNPR